MLKETLLQEMQQKKAQGAFLIGDLKKGQFLEHGADEVVPSASLIKLFILLEALGRVKDGGISMESQIAVSADDLVAFSVLEFLEPREYCLKELLKLMIVYSDNTATNVLMDFLGMDSINGRIQKCGCKKSVLQRKMMDFAAAEEGRQNLTTVREMADILQKLYKGELLGQPYDSQALDIMKGQADECMMRVNLPDEIPMARKSGELDCLDYDIAIVFTENTDYLFCFFVWDATTNNDAREILANVSKEVYQYYMEK